MKRKFKRIASLVLAAVMVFAMAMPAMAENVYNGDNLSLTIKGVASDDHTFKAYQIFTGTLNTTDIGNAENVENPAGTLGTGTAAAGTMLSNIKWGSGLTEAGKRFLMEKAGVTNPETADMDASLPKVVEWLDTSKAADLDAICKELVSAGGLSTASGTSATGTVQTDGTYNYVIDGLATGYYMVTDEITGEEGTDDAVSAYMVQLVHNKTVITKSSVPEVDKTVTDVNESTGNKQEGQKTADYGIGDMVPFVLTGTIGDNFAEYESYYFAFHDVQSDGLTFAPDTVEVKVDGTVVPVTGKSGGFPVNNYMVYTSTTDGCTFEIVFYDLKALRDAEGNLIPVNKDSVITVTYKSELNGQAVMGNTGNPNKVKLEYSNNPNNPEDHGTTPEKKVVVFTFDVTVNKQDDKGNALAGAAFQLEKWVDGDPTGPWKKLGDPVETNDGKTFNFEFVDDGIYRLTETTTPDGYNTIDPIYIQVTAEHEIDATTGEGKVTLKAVSGTFDENGTFTSGGDSASLAVNASSVNIDGKSVGTNGQASTDVVNHKGATLPETGGIGTTIFYVVGSVLVLAAVILLVTKRRMKSE